MTGTAIDTKAAVEVVKSAAGILPEAGKAAVLDHLLSEMSPATLKALSRETRAKLLANLQSFEASAPSLRENFDAISVSVPFNGKFFDVAVPNETFDKSRSDQTAIAVKIGGEVGTRGLNLAVVNYLLDREAFDLLAKEKAGTITNEQTQLLKLHREKWKRDKGAETRAKEAGGITEKQAALLKVYRDKWVRDSEGGLGVDGVIVRNDDRYDYVRPYFGALVACPSAESK